ncbi:hypothetical protein SLE2022_358870 [Rubroshorea leprosula]
MTRSLRILSTVAAPPPEGVPLESDFVVILAALLCALICVVGLIAVARCACFRRRSSVGTNQNNSAAARGSANRGLKKKILQSIPKFTYTKDSGGIAKFASVECAICLGEFVEGDVIRVLPQCGHGFHVLCIDTWLGSHSSCPSCRQILVVARCQKCGQFPAVSSGNASGSINEAQIKAREDTSILPANVTNNTFLP